jgi:hypothetical protein
MYHLSWLKKQQNLQQQTSQQFNLKMGKGLQEIFSSPKKQQKWTRCWWLMPAILASWEVEIRRIAIGRSAQIVHEVSSPK